MIIDLDYCLELQTFPSNTLWVKFAESYLDKPYTWLSSKFTKDNEEFTEEEIENLRNALLDIAGRIKNCAPKIWNKGLSTLLRFNFNTATLSFG